jgi:hypothetical protein
LRTGIFGLERLTKAVRAAPNQITDWKRQLLENAASVFAGVSAGAASTAFLD